MGLLPGAQFRWIDPSGRRDIIISRLSLFTPSLADGEACLRLDELHVETAGKRNHGGTKRLVPLERMEHAPGWFQQVRQGNLRFLPITEFLTRLTAGTIQRYTHAET